jgi:hypothetical protein
VTPPFIGNSCLIDGKTCITNHNLREPPVLPGVSHTFSIGPQPALTLYGENAGLGRNWMAKSAVRKQTLDCRCEKGTAMSFGIYLAGFLILIGGLVYGAVMLHVAAHWIAVGAIVLLGLAILKGVQATRGRDPSR